jgi:putative heme-binding domain-containing protein
LQDIDKDDRFEKITLLKTLVGEEEHGPHSIKLSPDGKSLYVVAGNHTQLPDGISNYTLPAVWQQDNILPDRFERDSRTADAAGWIAKVDSSGKTWELVSAGLRNTFDVAFNETGDLFTYDSDMEWDIGMPWYRPTRICHITSGSEWGWRDAAGKWSPDYLDNLPPLLNIGQGSPTNMMSVHNARFPAKYKSTLLAFDWSFGIIYAIHLQPDGASYKAQGEEFISGAPLPLTDGVVGPDGALYFLTGGRKLESHLYRVYYGNGKAAIASESGNQVVTEENKLRRQLESFHGAPNEAALPLAWPHLKNKDRFVRYAARIAVEHQPVGQWQEKVLTEKDPVILINSMAALARHGAKNLQPQMLNALLALDYKSLDAQLKLDLLRVYELIFARMGKPAPILSQTLITALSPQFPAQTNSLNRQLSKVLAFIGDPLLVPKTLALIDNAKDDGTDQATFSKSSDLILRNPQYGMDLAGVESNTPPAQQIYYAMVLSETKEGWTPELREKYFGWFHKAYSFKGGRFYVGYMDAARNAALALVPKKEYKHFDTLSTNTTSKKEVIDWVRIMSDGGPGRQWKLKDATDTVENLSMRNFRQAKAMFTAAACSNCHAMRGEGGAVGPDLTQLGTRFSKRDILESIIDPNKVISDQYVSTVFSLKDGSSVMGKLVKEEKEAYFISQNPFSPQTLRTLDKKLVTGTRNADVSLMPPALINQLNPERLRDLMAYLISGGNENHPVFKSANNTVKK